MKLPFLCIHLEVSSAGLSVPLLDVLVPSDAVVVTLVVAHSEPHPTAKQH